MNQTDTDIYAVPRKDIPLESCSFYHTMETPGYGVQKGLWDLRGVEHLYLGNTQFKHKRVLEIGPASGALSFYMEQQGAEVVVCDIDEAQVWDVVPYADRSDYEEWGRERQQRLRQLNNSFWFGHQARDSKINVVYDSVYTLPKAIGTVDIGVLASVLLHLRDPFLALQNVAALTKEKMIVTETFFPRFVTGFFTELLSKVGIRLPYASFLPYPGRNDLGTWWHLTPEVTRQMLSVLGFARFKTTYHMKSRHKGNRQVMYTIVAERTQPLRSSSVAG